MNKYIVWTRDGGYGWTPAEYDTLEQAIKHEGYGMEKIITKEVSYEVKEIE